MNDLQVTNSGLAIRQETGADWALLHGDCCEVMKGLPDASIDYCIHSPPFSSLYIYSDSQNDMGNCQSHEEFFVHYGFCIRELFRLMVTGRLVSVHCKDLPLYFNRDGASGLYDFPGDIVKAYESAGFVFHSRVTIWKCPVTERERTNNNGLLHKTICRDRSQVRQGMADFLLTFRKPTHGTLMSDKPIANEGGLDVQTVPLHESVYRGECDPRKSDEHPSKYARKGNDGRESIVIWRRYAEPVWWDIDQTDVLNYKAGRSDNDERHICPLQLGVIERAVQLWSMPGEIVLSPFAGVGSEGVGSIRLGRKFIGIELKDSYIDEAVTNIGNEVREVARRSRSLFDFLAADAKSELFGEPLPDANDEYLEEAKP